MPESHRCIAIIDGNTSIRTALSRLLRACEFNAYPFASGQDLLDSGKLDCTSCVLMESDLDALRRLNGCSNRLPVIVMGDHDNPDVRSQFISAGADDYLCRPFDAANLFGTIARALRLP